MYVRCVGFCLGRLVWFVMEEYWFWTVPEQLGIHSADEGQPAIFTCRCLCVLKSSNHYLHPYIGVTYRSPAGAGVCLCVLKGSNHYLHPYIGVTYRSPAGAGVCLCVLKRFNTTIFIHNTLESLIHVSLKYLPTALRGPHPLISCPKECTIANGHWVWPKCTNNNN